MDSPSSRRLIYSLLIIVAVGMAAGRVCSTLRVYEPNTYRGESDPKDDPRGVWPAKRPLPMPTFGSNDRSRWATVRSLVDDGTYVVGRRDRDLTVATAVSALGATDLLQFVTISQAGY